MKFLEFINENHFVEVNEMAVDLQKMAKQEDFKAKLLDKLKKETPTLADDEDFVETLLKSYKQTEL